MTTKRKIGRPLKGTTPVRTHKQISFRATTEQVRKWEKFQKKNPNHTHGELFDALLGYLKW